MNRPAPAYQAWCTTLTLTHSVSHFVTLFWKVLHKYYYWDSIIHIGENDFWIAVHCSDHCHTLNDNYSQIPNTLFLKSSMGSCCLFLSSFVCLGGRSVSSRPHSSTEQHLRCLGHLYQTARLSPNTGSWGYFHTHPGLPLLPHVYKSNFKTRYHEITREDSGALRVYR